MSLKEIIFSMMNEALENMDEAAVEVSNKRYTPSHGKQPRGSGSWMFTHKDKGDVNVNDKEEVHTAHGNFPDAKKSAQKWAKERGHSTVYVMEEVEQIDEETMPSNVASRLADSHFTAAFHHKKNGNMKGYASHLKVANRIEDAVIRAGSHMPIRSIQIEKASDKAFSDHPHRVVKNEEVEQIDENWSKGASSSYRSDAIAAAKQKAKAASLSTAANKLGKDNPQHNELMSDHHKAMAKFVKHSYHAGAYPSMAIAKKDYNSHMDQAKKYNSAVTENYELDEAKTDIYHKHMLKALGKTRLPKDHPYTSAVANNGDFVVRNGSGVVARIPKGEHNLK
jgi:hypothetical protein